MTTQKLITYVPLNIEGNTEDLTHELNLTVLEKSGNYSVHKDIIRQNLLKKQGTVSTKTRSEVRGGGRKPWKQKGTGRARAGSKSSPLWKGGGVVFGPKPNQNIKYKVNKKEQKLALQTLLYNKKDKITVLGNLEDDFNTPKTKQFIRVCEACNLDINTNLLVVVSEKTDSLKLATKNLNTTNLVSASTLNTFNLMKAKQIVITSKALNDIKERFCE
jgi:large subunit ribosomal protein L4